MQTQDSHLPLPIQPRALRPRTSTKYLLHPSLRPPNPSASSGCLRTATSTMLHRILLLHYRSPFEHPTSLAWKRWAESKNQYHNIHSGRATDPGIVATPLKRILMLEFEWMLNWM